MIGFEYGVYSPGDLCLKDGETTWREIASYNSIVVKFTDGTVCNTDQIQSVRMINVKA